MIENILRFVIKCGIYIIRNAFLMNVLLFNDV